METETKIKTITAASFPSTVFSRLVMGLCIFLFLIILIGAVSIPFVFESQSILYKFGANKIMLRVGKILGITAALLILVQVIFSARLKILDRTVALDRLYSFHRLNAILITALIVLHPVLVLIPEGLTNISFDLRSWPEMVGTLLLFLLLSIAVTGIWRLKFNLSFDRWLFIHRLATSTVVLMLGLHVLYVSDTFKQPIPRFSVLVVCGIYFFVLAWIKIKAKLLRAKPWIVKGVTALNKDTFNVELSPVKEIAFSYFPGQFAFLTFASRGISSEEHPFTISSSPTRPNSLSFTVRSCGDWTRKIEELKVGDTAFVDGPYGKFSFLSDKNCDIVMIAGGIGITPMLSMLRYMADTEETRKITLIWSNRTKQNVICENELNKLKNRLPGFQFSHVFTRESTEGEGGRRLDQAQLQTFSKDCDRRAAVFLCGPLPLMQNVRNWLVKLGFVKKNIHWEKFSL